MSEQVERWGVWAWAVTGPFANRGSWLMWGDPPRGHWMGDKVVAEAKAKDLSTVDRKAEARPYVPVPSSQWVVFHGATSSRTLTKMTVLDGYYASGAHDDGFVFDIHHPEHDHGAALREWWSSHEMDADIPAELLDNTCRVYPNTLLPDGVECRKGRWTVTVTFEPEDSK